MVHTVTLVDGPASKSATICGSVARLSRLMILVSRRWSRSCMIFFQPQRSRRCDILPDSRYSRYTHEMVVREKILISSLPRRRYVPSIVHRLLHPVQTHLNLDNLLL
ncbi:uncharacterized protein TNCV_1604401 [Trichonephila clavipes]|nr:uncharacterized protein TNCV_1604401 [Trichonephila clavipes]